MAKVNIELEIIDAMDLLAFITAVQSINPQKNPQQLIYHSKIERIFQSIYCQVLDKTHYNDVAAAVAEREKEDADLF